MSGRRSRFNRSKRSNDGTFRKRKRSGKRSFSKRRGKRPFSKSKRHNRGEKIDISKFIRKEVSDKASASYSPKNSFEAFGLDGRILANLESKGFTSPTAIQDQSVPHIMDGRDLIGLANTGTGKTAAFLLPLIHKASKRDSQKTLIITPTRELAMQINQEIRDFSKGLKIHSTVCVGGVPIGRQIRSLKNDSDFIVGTPGRLKDLSSRRLIKFENIQKIVLDEVDRMLDMGFVDEITNILTRLPKSYQGLFFSATLPDKIKKLANKHLKNPEVVEAKTGDTAAKVIQDVVRVKNRQDKPDKLKRLLKDPDFKKVLVFIETKREVDRMTSSLSKSGFRVQSIHGDKRQNQRKKSLRAFRENRCDVLVATDVAARGLDIDDVSHVINYTVPQTYDDYVHRIGRTGRGEKTGQALTFV